MGRIDAVRAMLAEQRRGFRIDEEMNGTHRFIDERAATGEQPLVFDVELCMDIL